MLTLSQSTVFSFTTLQQLTRWFLLQVNNASVLFFFIRGRSVESVKEMLRKLL
jgi:hypothetical protein